MLVTPLRWLSPSRHQGKDTHHYRFRRLIL